MTWGSLKIKKSKYNNNQLNSQIYFCTNTQERGHKGELHLRRVVIFHVTFDPANFECNSQSNYW